MQLNELVKEAHDLAVEKGWYEGPPRSPLEVHALIHTEISEATEAVRKWLPATCVMEGTGKPEGEAVELADAIIRIADYFGAMGWDLEDTIKLKMRYNKTRSHRHGAKAY
jgi:hypothetical protein